MKKQLIALMGLFSSFIFNAPALATDELVIYSSRTENLIAPLISGFKQHYQVEVKLLTGKEEALIERLKREGQRSPADIFMTVDAGNLGLAAAQGLFQPLNLGTTPIIVPAYLIDKNQLWTSLSLRARTLVYSSQRVKPEELSSYADLANSKWQGRLCLRTSQKVYNKSLAAAMVAHEGEAGTRQIIQGWVNNLATKPFAKDDEVMLAIDAGQCDVGIVNTYYFYRLKEKNPQLQVALFWANQDSTGTHINVSGAGITRYAPHSETARAFLRYLLSPEAQDIYAKLNHEFSIADLNAQRLPFKADSLAIDQLHHQQQRGVKIMQEVGYL